MRRPFLRALVRLLALVALAAATPAVAQDSSRQQAQARQQLAELRSKMEALAREQAQTAARRDSANAKLARQANALADAARALREVDAALAAKQQQLEQLQQQRSELDQRLAGQRAAIADLLRATYTLGRGTDLRLLLGDQDLAQIARALAYSKYFQQDRAARVAELMGELSRLQQLQAQITAEQQALAATRAEQAQKTQALAAQRAAQRKLVAQADAKYKDEAQRLAAMKRNAQSLVQQGGKLERAIDEAAREAARESRSSPAAPSRAGGKADIRGNLPWPAAGAVVGYGNGVLIKATGGSEVHAVARGRVAYADWLKGYGMLLILDHGDGYMSLYGYNDALRRDVGDWVAPGETIALSGASGGQRAPALYFELRLNGEPINPKSWLR
jgi:septal ring factor EnvC (AmiA/AmiB activator)